MTNQTFYLVSFKLFSVKLVDGVYPQLHSVSNELMNDTAMRKLQSSFFDLSVNKGLDWFQAISFDIGDIVIHSRDSQKEKCFISRIEPNGMLITLKGRGWIQDWHNTSNTP